MVKSVLGTAFLVCLGLAACAYPVLPAAPTQTPWIITVIPPPAPVSTVAAPPVLAPVPLPAPTNPVPGGEIQVSFMADRTTITRGACAQLQWNVQGAEVVQLNGDPAAPAGQKQVCPPQSTLYTLVGFSGSAANFKRSEIQVVVTDAAQIPSAPQVPTAPLPACAVAFTLSADRMSLTAGESATLVWTLSCPGCTMCAQHIYLDGVDVGGNGSKVVSPGATTTYTLRVVKTDGSSEERKVTISVNAAVPPAAAPPPSGCAGAPVITAFNANPATIDIAAGSKGQTTLSWGAVANATSAVIDQGIGGVATPGSQVVTLDKTTTYTLVATGCGGTTSKQATIVVNVKPVVVVIPGADLALTDLYADKLPQGNLYGRVTNNGPDSVTNLEVSVACSWSRTATGAQFGLMGSSGPKKLTLTSLAPGQTAAFNAGVAIDTNGHIVKMTCTLTVPFGNLNTNKSNDSYTESFP